MMRGGKEEEKIMGPLFPRLNVNDTNKGGPRAPPRNKMALYEQFSIPSQRFPLPSHNASTLVPSMSSSQGCGNERNVFSPFYNPPQTPAHSSEKVPSHSSDRMNLSATRMEIERENIKHVSKKSSNATGSAAETSSLHPHDFSKVENSCRKKFDEEDDFRVPTFVHSGNAACSKKELSVMEIGRLTPFCENNPQESCAATATFNFSVEVPNSYDRTMERMNTSGIKSREHERLRCEEEPKEITPIKEHTYKSITHPETGEKFSEPSNFVKRFSDQENVGSENVLENINQGSTVLCQESCGDGALGGPRCLNDILQNGDKLRVSESRSKASGGNSKGLNVVDSCNRRIEDMANELLDLGDAEINGEVSETSIVDSISGLEISPDDVVGILGPKHFWKARRAIVHQQKVFAVQVFELHRLMKVQKLIAASPHLLLRENHHVSKSPLKGPTKELPLDSINSKPQIVKQIGDYQKPNQDSLTKNTIGAPPLPSSGNNINKGRIQIPGHGPYSRNPPPVPMTSDNKPAAWCFYPPAHQWLVPVMSPSEGLIYKPYTGSYPPTAGFMAPIYGSYGPLSIPPVAGNPMNPACGIPASHQQQNMSALSGAPAIAPNYFPTPYGLPVANQIISASAMEQVRPLGRSQPNEQAEQNSRSSCNMPNPNNEATSGCLGKFQASKGSELRGSTTSCPCERPLGEGNDALSLFPTAPATEGSAQPSQSYGREHQSHVIKVVPHNARSATESVARIFRSIQEERQQNES